jgi:hypothetical protein
MKYEIKLHFNFIDDLKFIKNFVSKLQNRPILTGFAVEINEGKVFIIATDSYKLVEATLGEIEDKSIVYIAKSYPAAIFDLVVKVMKKAGGIFSIDTDNDRVSFKESATAPEYSVTALPGTYPVTRRLFDGIDTEIVVKKEWYQEFQYRYKESELRPTLPVIINGVDGFIYFDRDNFDFIIKHLKGAKGKIYHTNNACKSILLSFESNWTFRIIVLPVRVE